MTTHALIAEVPLVPAAGAIIGYLGSLLIFCLAVALTVMWVQILRGPLIRLAKVHFLGVRPFGWVNGVVTNVDHWLKAAEQGGERGMTWSLHTLMWSFSTTAKLTRDLAEATYHLRNRVVHMNTRHVSAPIPQSISPRIKTLEREYKGIDARLDRVERREQAKRTTGAAAGAQDESLLRRGIDRLNKRVGHVEHELAGVEHAQEHAGARARVGAPAIPRTAPRNIAKARKASRHWTDVLTQLSAVALVGYALARMGLGWLRCPALGRIGRKVGCGGFHFLELLLAETLDVLLLRDLCGIVKTIEKIAIAFEDDLLRLVNEIEGFICGGEAVVPSGIVRADLKAVAKHPTAITAYDLKPPVARKIAA